jgi:ABC-type dipeptide/oligopeptide/nickel transport systems, permease components
LRAAGDAHLRAAELRAWAGAGLRACDRRGGERRSLRPRAGRRRQHLVDALPTFCVGVVGILVFSIWLGWLPVLGGLLLPVLIIGIDNAGQIVKPLFEELQEAATAAHVRTARAKGLGPLRIALFHLLPAAVPVAMALSGLVLAGLISGTLTMEVLFGRSGIGSLVLNAIHGRDYPVIQAAVVVIALGLVAINAVVDLLHHWIDPRVAR